MAQSAMNVTVAPGPGAPVDLSAYGYEKTFAATGDDSFDGLIECSNGGEFAPVGRLTGQVSVVIPIWGRDFRINRVDGKQSAVNVVVKAPDSLGALRVSVTSLQIADPPFVVAVDHLIEPFSLLCWADATSPDEDGIVVVSGINGGQSVAIGTISPGRSLNIDGGADYDSIAFDLSKVSDPNAVIDVSLCGKTPDASLPTGIVPYFSLLKLASDGAGGLVITDEQERTMAKVVLPIVTNAPGDYTLNFDVSLPLSTGAMEFASIEEHLPANVMFVDCVMSTPNALRIRTRNIAGALVAPAGAFQMNAGVLLS